MSYYKDTDYGDYYHHLNEQAEHEAYLSAEAEAMAEIEAIEGEQQMEAFTKPNPNGKEALAALRELAPNLEAAYREAGQARSAYKSYEAEWLRTPEVKSAGERKKAATAEETRLKKKAKGLLANCAEAGMESIDSSWFSLQPGTAIVPRHESDLIHQIITHIPGLAVQLLSVNMEALQKACEDNPLLRAMLPDTEFVTDPGSAKTTIHWSKLAEPEQTNEQIKIELGAKYRALLDDSNTVILDTETTGVNVKKDEPVEIAIINTEGAVLFNERVMPSVDISPEAEKVHGIPMSDLLTKPSFDKITTELSLSIQGKQVLTYNAKFDRAMILNAAKAHDLIAISADRWECVMLDYAAFNGTPGRNGAPKWWKLTEACANHGIEIENAHAAQGDCQMTLRLMEEMAAYGSKSTAKPEDDEVIPF